MFLPDKTLGEQCTKAEAEVQEQKRALYGYLTATQLKAKFLPTQQQDNRNSTSYTVLLIKFILCALYFFYALSILSIFTVPG